MRAAQVQRDEAAAEHQGAQAWLQTRCSRRPLPLVYVHDVQHLLNSCQAGSAVAYPACKSLPEMRSSGGMCMGTISTC